MLPRVLRASSLSLSLLACDDPRPKRAPDPTPAPAPVPTDAPSFYAQRCAQCHGETGQGDGPAGKNLQPWPRNFASKEWQASASDEQIRSIIVRGGQAVGKSPTMPASPELADKPQIVAGLVQIVRGFGKK
jgi:mono/diheme cytochrome c family protein